MQLTGYDRGGEYDHQDVLMDGNVRMIQAGISALKTITVESTLGKRGPIAVASELRPAAPLASYIATAQILHRLKRLGMAEMDVVRSKFSAAVGILDRTTVPVELPVHTNPLVERVLRQMDDLEGLGPIGRRIPTATADSVAHSVFKKKFDRPAHPPTARFVRADSLLTAKQSRALNGVRRFDDYEAIMQYVARQRIPGRGSTIGYNVYHLPIAFATALLNLVYSRLRIGDASGTTQTLLEKSERKNAKGKRPDGRIIQAMTADVRVNEASVLWSHLRLSSTMFLCNHLPALAAASAPLSTRGVAWDLYILASLGDRRFSLPLVDLAVAGADAAAFDTTCSCVHLELERVSYAQLGRYRTSWTARENSRSGRGYGIRATPDQSLRLSLR